MTREPPITDAWVAEWDAKRERRTAQIRESNKRCYERKMLIGQCSSCHRQAIAGQTKCHIHRESSRIISLKKNYKRRLDVDTLHADSDRMKNKQREWKSIGLCAKCGLCNPEPGILSCRRCKDLQASTDKLRYKKRKSIGMCYRCSHPVVYGGTRCAWHQEEKRLRDRKNRLLAKERKNAEKER